MRFDFTHILLWISAVMMSSCFKAREPLPPDANTTWLTPTEPDILVENFKHAVVDFNINNYARCIKTSTFVFEADPTIKANNQGLFNTWRWDQEWQYLNNLARLRANTSANRLTFSNPRTINFTADSLEYTAPYELILFHNDTAFAPNFFKGQISFIIVRNRNNEWEIAAWYDLKNSDATCWTELKQHFISR